MTFIDLIIIAILLSVFIVGGSLHDDIRRIKELLERLKDKLEKNETLKSEDMKYRIVETKGDDGKSWFEIERKCLL